MLKKIMAMTLAAIFAVSGVVASDTLVGTQASPAYAQGSETVMLRLVHAIPGAGEVDVYVDGFLIAPRLDYKDATPHINFPAGEHSVALRAAGDAPTSAAIFEGFASLIPSNDGFRQATAIIQTDSEGAVQLALYNDDLNPSELGWGRIHAIHTVAGLEAVDILGTNRAQIATNIEFGVPAGSVNAPVNTYDLVVAPAGETPENALLAIGEVNVNTNTLYTIIVVGTPSELDSIVLSRPLFAKADIDTVLTSIAHGSSDAPAVDVYANDVLIILNLQPGQITPHLALPAGDVSLAVRAAGTPANSEPAFESTVNLTSSTGAATVAALGTLSDGLFSFSIHSDDIAALQSDLARVSVLNSTSTGPANVELSDGTTLADGLAPFSTSGTLDVASGVYTVSGTVDDETGPVSFEIVDYQFIGGFYYTVLVFLGDEATINISATPIIVLPNSMPGSVFELDSATPEPTAEATEEVTPETTPEVTVEVTVESTVEVTLEPTVEVVTTPEPTQAPPVATTPPTTTQNVLYGVVNLNQGANLQCREYPTSAAFSQGLIPNATQLIVRGYAGPIDEEDGQPVTPLEEGAFAEPKTAEEFEDIWVRVDYVTPEGGTIWCWVRSDFLTLTYRNRSIRDVEEFFALEELELFPPVLEMIPSNYPGQPIDDSAIISPPTPQRNDPVATVNLDSGVSLHLRRTPVNTGESLLLLPNGTEVYALERIEGEVSTEIGAPDLPDWLYVEYTTELGTSYGWISAQYVVLSQRGRRIDIEEIPLADEIKAGEVNVDTGNAPPPSSSAGVNTNIFLGTLVNLNVGANLNLRDSTSVDGKVLASIPAGSQIVVLGRNGSGTWLNVRYEVAGEAPFEGWVSANFVDVTRNNQTVSVGELPITSGEADTFVEGAVPATVTPTVENAG